MNNSYAYWVLYLPFTHMRRINLYMADFPTLTDESLVERICDGDHRAFAILVERHSAMFFKAAYRICGNETNAEDIVQEAFLKLWKRPDSYDASKGAKFTTWFYRVISNLAIDATRKNAGKFSESVEGIEIFPDNSVLQDRQYEMNMEQKNLEDAIQTLPERQKLALNLCFYEGLSNKEAADVIGVGLKALESLLMRAKKALKTQLSEQSDAA